MNNLHARFDFSTWSDKFLKWPYWEFFVRLFGTFSYPFCTIFKEGERWRVYLEARVSRALRFLLCSECSHTNFSFSSSSSARAAGHRPNHVNFPYPFSALCSTLHSKTIYVLCVSERRENASNHRRWIMLEMIETDMLNRSVSDGTVPSFIKHL